MATTSPKGASVVRLMTKVLGKTFGGETWSTWRSVLKAAFALALTDDERAVVYELTHRTVLPSEPVQELWLLLGRRSGKSLVAALVAVWACCCRTYTLAAGEVGIFMILAADRRQARVIKRYIAGLLKAHPALTALIQRETQDAIWLTNGLCIEIHTASFRTLRGYTVVGACCDEIAFWQDAESANPDHEVLVALKAAMASVPEAVLVALTSVYARRGEAWRVFEKHFGNDSSSDVLVVNGATRRMNPTISEAVIQRAFDEDAAAAATEFGAIWRNDVETFVAQDVLLACVEHGVLERPPVSGVFYSAFVDPSGGSGKDEMTLAVGHREGDRIVIDAVRASAPPFQPSETVREFAELLKAYRVTRVSGDKYAGAWPSESFWRVGIQYDGAGRSKSQFYVDSLALLNSKRIVLLDEQRLLTQIVRLERRTGRGRDVIDHPPNSHDDRANAVLGLAAEIAAQTPGSELGVTWGEYSGSPADAGAPWGSSRALLGNWMNGLQIQRGRWGSD